MRPPHPSRMPTRALVPGEPGALSLRRPALRLSPAAFGSGQTPPSPTWTPALATACTPT